MDKSKYKRKIYLQDTPRQEALAYVLNNFSPKRKIEKIASTESLGRVRHFRYLQICRAPTIMHRQWMGLL